MNERELELGTIAIASLIHAVAGRPEPLPRNPSPDSPWFTGVVRGPDGEPLPGARVSARSPPEEWLESRTDEEGRFRLGPFPGAKRISIRVHAPGYFLRDNWQGGCQVRVKGRAVVEQNLDLVRAGVIRGRFVPRDPHRLLEGRRIDIYHPTDPRGPREGIYHHAALDADGRFVFDTIEPDLDWWVTIEGEKGEILLAGPRKVRGSTAGVEVVLPENFPVRVSYTVPAERFTAETPRWLIVCGSVFEGAMEWLPGFEPGPNWQSLILTAENPVFRHTEPGGSTTRVLAVALPVPEDARTAKILRSDRVELPPKGEATVRVDRPVRGAQVRGRLTNRTGGRVRIVWGRGYSGLDAPVGEDGSFEFPVLFWAGTYRLSWQDDDGVGRSRIYPDLDLEDGDRPFLTLTVPD